MTKLVGKPDYAQRVENKARLLDKDINHLVNILDKRIAKLSSESARDRMIANELDEQIEELREAQVMLAQIETIAERAQLQAR